MGLVISQVVLQALTTGNLTFHKCLFSEQTRKSLGGLAGSETVSLLRHTLGCH